MMPIRIYQKCFDVVLVMLLAIHFLFAHSGLPGYVLCIGSNGHVAMEASIDQGNCNDRDSYSGSARVGDVDAIENAASTHCGPCVDVSLHANCNEDVPNLQKRSIPPAILLPNGSDSYLAGFPENRPHPPTVDFTAVHSLTLTTLHTTVLLI